MSAPPIKELAELFGLLPGVGERTSLRYVFSILERHPQYAERLGKSLSNLRSRIKECVQCANYTENDLCDICIDSRRNAETLCVVARVPELMAIERASLYRGHYHVLHGLLSPLDGISPDTLHLERVKERVLANGIKEVIIATPLSVDGEATALFISEMLRETDASVSRIASGVPHGGELEFTDQITLGRAFEERKTIT